MDGRPILASRAHLVLINDGFERSRLEKSLESKEKELKYLSEETERLHMLTCNLLIKSREVSHDIDEKQNEILMLESYSDSLDKAINLSKDKNVKRRSALDEMKSANRKWLYGLELRAQALKESYELINSVKMIKEKTVALERVLDGLAGSGHRIHHQMEEEGHHATSNFMCVQLECGISDIKAGI